MSFEASASNTTWTDSWVGVVKTLVVVYRYDGIVMLDEVKEHQCMHFLVSPPAYGIKDVTDKVRKLVKNHALTVAADNYTFHGDPWPGHR